MSKVSAPDVVKPKRGRKSKKDILASQELAKNSVIETKPTVQVENNIELQILNEIKEETPTEHSDDNIANFLPTGLEEENVVVKPVSKKRGRKPKGGKIIQQTLPIVEQKENKPNIILHLKCSLKDLQTSGDYNSNFTCSNIDSFQFSGSNDLSYEIINKPDDSFLKTLNTEPGNNATTSANNSTLVQNLSYNDVQADDVCETKEIWRKLKTLEHNLHINNISDKKSACFWCSCDFDNPPIYIPKNYIKDSYQVYGCFCSPECAVAHLMEENIDSSTKFERYYLINHIYSKIYQYSKNIKPAPNPHYMLDKYYGNLTIQEYRALLKSERLFLIVDKPLTRILPEFHEDNDEFIINNKIIPSNNFQLKKRLQKKQQTKNNILNEKFGISSS
ncbi:MAG: hypothetical protein EBY20_02505 [Alphaproteobacteria bacterium]|uniref:MYM-type domain-containing protein n=1 Tax=viral metagenome TaxID=1070528 RepID=A0A6C0HQQ7_9ZZZZ|nr:hypothetical protein [Alphaproteobacteria bacterium]